MRARALVASAMVLTLTAACGDDPGKKPEADPSPSSSASPTIESTETPTVGADHVMDPIGPRTGQVANPDILITDADSLSDETVQDIKDIKGVTGVEQFSMVNVVIENRSYNVAAVNPATYRNYTELAVADSQDIWDRIAGGELGLRKRLSTVLPQDANQFVRLGGSDQAKSVHIGALTNTVADVDAVVNETWIDDLGMVPDNALLVRTGPTAPQTLRTKVEQAASGASVAMVDVVAREGLDPKAKQVAVTTGTVADVVGVFRYSVIGGGRIAPEQSWVSAHIITKTVPILGQVTCNKFVFPQLEAALKDVIENGLQDKIHPNEYAGCYYPRFIAGTTKLSNHSFGLALDLNTPGNQRGTVGEMDRGVVAIFKYWGFAWGGDWDYTDPMHFEMVELKNPANP